MTFYITPILVTVATLASFYRHVVYPAFVSPLAKIPAAHWSCHFCSLWLLWVKWNKTENAAVYNQHLQKGPAVRLAPSILSVNCYEDGLKTIYQGGFPKTNFYSRGFNVYGTENIFTFEENEPHAAVKRLISHTFSKSSIMASPSAQVAVRDILFGQYLPVIARAAAENTRVEVLALHYAYSMDTFTQWQFGKKNASDFMNNEAERTMYLNAWFGLTGETFWQSEFPNFANLLRKIGIFLIPQKVDDGFRAIEEWNLKKCDDAQQLLASSQELSPENQPTIFGQAIKSMSELASKPGDYPERLRIAGDNFTHNSAAFETVGNTMTYLCYEMCRNPEWQIKLQEELQSLHPPLRFQLTDDVVACEDLTDPKDLDALPILQALIMETLRLYPPVPAGQPRRVPETCTLAGYSDIPVGTTVQSYAWTLHRMPEIFPDPDAWKPDRWLEASQEQMTIMKHWFWAFSSGPRMCIGSHFALYSMKYLLASLYTNFTTAIHDHGDMSLIDGFLAGPKGHRLELKFQSTN